MQTISQAVEKIVERSPFIEESIASGLVNLSELARQIKPDVEEEMFKDIQIGAIVMALKRLSPRFRIRQNKAEGLIGKISDLSLKSNLVEYTFRNSSSLITNIHKLLDIINKSVSQFITLSRGVHETTIIVNHDLESSIKKIFAKEIQIFKLTNVSSLTIILPPENIDVPGVYYIILKELSWNGINLLDVVSTTNEITVFVEDSEISHAFAVMKRMIGKNK